MTCEDVIDPWFFEENGCGIVSDDGTDLTHWKGFYLFYIIQIKVDLIPLIFYSLANFKFFVWWLFTPYFFSHIKELIQRSKKLLIILLGQKSA